jgi:hypothetical protein
MLISNLIIEEKNDVTRISADIDDFRLWFHVPNLYKVSGSADAFLAAALLPAMKQGEEIDIDSKMTVSHRLLQNIHVLQEIFHSWNPKELKIVAINAKGSPARTLNSGVVSFFSGGVDSTYTFLKRRNEISHFIFMHGFDFFISKTDELKFSRGDIIDLGQFAQRLVLPRNPIDAFIKNKLSPTTLHALNLYESSGLNPSQLEGGLVNDLNTILAGHSIYEKTRFGSVKLRLATKEMLDQKLSEVNTACLNKLLLEDACSQELSRNHTGDFSTAIKRNTDFMQYYDKILVPIEHNHYAFGYRYNLSRNLSFGSCLASVALLLGFASAYIPASYSYSQLFPLGSHPLTDPLWSNEGTEIIHDGCEAKRTDKLAMISGCEPALKNLRVCFNDINNNCGKCSKCLRTMTSLELMGITGTPFPPFPSVKVIEKSNIYEDIEAIYFMDNLELVGGRGKKELKDALKKCIRKHELRKLFVKFDNLILKGTFKKIYQRMMNISPLIRRVCFTVTAD